MPFKERYKRGKKNSCKRNQKKKITNWKAYNEALESRGSLTFLIENEALEKWYAPKISKLGRPFKYSVQNGPVLTNEQNPTLGSLGN